ncbi:hypothetical protein GE107_15110 [Cohnella sp. CFH 77786]|uniref:hypothetical protein n=1 Tax=Cohnella sp. CFH 77786 TaxID=2662265 RepID=UPI001C60C2F5|nr:hypothetical protein [Cohnella sp. CFH 77786]MBW5447385.1 hypothetical protein [Cohnella sp. CFH 77786]
MNRLEREWEIRLHLLESIARSQEALAAMLESAADVTAAAGVSPAALREHVRVLEGMQAALLRTVTGTGWRPPKRGTPVSPWLKAGVCPAGQRGTGGVA